MNIKRSYSVQLLSFVYNIIHHFCSDFRISTDMLNITIVPVRPEATCSVYNHSYLTHTWPHLLNISEMFQIPIFCVIINVLQTV